MSERGAITFGPIVGVIVIILAFIGLLAICNENEDIDTDGLGRVELVSHEYDGGCDPYYDDCYDDDRGRAYEGERGSRNGRDKRTCFFGCDNIIVIPNPLDPGGGQGDPEQPRSSDA